MLFVDNLYKHADFTNIDRPSLGSDESHKNAYLQHVLTVFSPLIVDNQVIAVLRQYYYQPSQHTQQRARSVSCKKLETMSNLLQYSLNVNTQLRDVHRELNYINKEYYQHFIKMVNHGQCSSERGEEILKNTLAELK